MMVPSGWEICDFEKAGIKTIDGDRGKNYPKKSEYLKQGHCLFLGADNITNNCLDISSTTFITQEKHKQLGQGVVCYDDLLLIMRGNGTGRICSYDQDISPYIDARINSGLVIIRLNQKLNNKNYILQLMRSEFITKQFDSYMFGSAQPQLTIKILKSLRLPLPPLPEQRKIAKILSCWDKSIATTEKLIAASKQQKKALMQQLLTGKKRLADPETGKAFDGEWRKSKTPYESLPFDWSELALEKLSSFITKGATPTTYGFEWQQYGIPFLRSECVGKNGFKESGLNYICDSAHEVMARSKVYAGDILITITGNVGRVCRLPNKYPQANINQHIAKVTLKDENVCSDFIFHCLQDNKYQTSFERITTGQAYPQISLVQVRNTIVPLPSIYEQQKIAEVLTAADKEIELLEQKLSHLKNEKKALMQQLLTGKRRVSSLSS